MIEIKQYDGWDKYKGLSQGSGRSEKIWLQSGDGRIGLFKFPKVDDNGNISSTEHISEHMASHIGKILDIPVADIDIGYRNGRIGCMSYLIGSEIEEGVYYVTQKYPSFDSDKLLAKDEGMYYCLDMLIESVGDVLPDGWFIPMMIFDYLIGNSDRHQSNWAVQTTIHQEYRLCPLYDNGSSLCSYIAERDIDKYLGNDKLRFRALVTTKSKSRIRIDGYKKKEPSHIDIMRVLLRDYKKARDCAREYAGALTEKEITDMLSEYPSEILSDRKKLLIDKFINAKRDELTSLL